MKKPLKTIALAFIFPCLIFLGCKEVVPEPVARFEFRERSSDRTGAIYEFNNTSRDAESYEWYFGDGGGSIQKNPVYKFRQNGTYKVQLFAKSKGGENLFEQTIRVSSVPTTGKVIFWSRISDKGSITVNIAGNEVGKITVYQVASGEPVCDTQGFVTVNLKEGTYSYTARSQGLVQISWSGTITVVNGQCSPFELRR